MGLESQGWRKVAPIIAAFTVFLLVVGIWYISFTGDLSRSLEIQEDFTSEFAEDTAEEITTKLELVETLATELLLTNQTDPLDQASYAIFLADQLNGDSSYHGIHTIDASGTLGLVYPQSVGLAGSSFSDIATAEELIVYQQVLISEDIEISSFTTFSQDASGISAILPMGTGYLIAQLDLEKLMEKIIEGEEEVEVFDILITEGDTPIYTYGSSFSSDNANVTSAEIELYSYTWQIYLNPSSTTGSSFLSSPIFPGVGVIASVLAYFLFSRLVAFYDKIRSPSPEEERTRARKYLENAKLMMEDMKDE
ncbi:MAG: hypothetical protein ACXAE3_09520 [Candidatus Kariarchaeaceae archaeon]